MNLILRNQFNGSWNGEESNDSVWDNIWKKGVISIG